MTDAAGHNQTPIGTGDEGRMRLLRDGTLIWQDDQAYVVDAEVPADAATYRLESTLKHNPPWPGLNSRTDLAWTFRSARIDDAERLILPLSTVRFLPKLDDRDRAPKGKRFTIPVRVERAPGALVTTVQALTVDVSYDRGKTWTAAALSGSGETRTATVTHPVVGTTVSLRASATNADGSRVDLTLIDAYLLK